MPKAPPPAVTVDLPRARAFWHRQQGLADPIGDSPHAIVQAVGWLRTLGGIDAYLALWSRGTGLTRAAVDEALASGQLRVSPAARGCIYLVPREDLGLVMRFAEGLWRPRAEKDVAKAGGTWKEIDAVATAVLEALGKRSLTTDEIRAALPDGTVRSYGATGKKVGLSSPLPVALRQLEFDGKVERMVSTGRLDTERYVWRRARGKAFGGSKVPSDPQARTGAIVERFLQSAGPATIKDLAAWSGLSQTEAKAGLARIGAVPVMVEGYGPSFVRAGDEQALAEISPEAKGWRLLSFEDNYTTLHGGPAVLVDPIHHGVSVKIWGRGGDATLGEAKHLASRAILWGSELVGFWEHDPDHGAVVTGLLGQSPRGQKTALTSQAKALEHFIAEQLGHARSFSLDTDDALRTRVALVRAIGHATAGKSSGTA
ncbi:DNA glycosylase AlkZ-like family protein [Paraliomyxa miuraensis]|uniref:DNA glycosylase AlkZ-like family protein n=1 Tax=Paraliomyxa miuraensis TaxID=376150 RepID=UPI00224FFDE1|nr:crosslink repair DNA glycosylase YcaQ family protein [Paraliomyxa miuraensis]MCX4242679.1 winged helix DNA-binding domain-containing protein [Paraliomyxa miuraensis]